ncbi:MAG: cytochrome P450 [Steroidobacteraceae bacterium]
MQALEDRDYFSDHFILKEPYAYFEAIRAKGPVYQLPGSGIVVVTGFDETLEVLKNTQDFSSVIAPQGPAAPLPFQPQGSDITPQIEAHRTEFVGGDLVVTYDDAQHTLSRSLLNRLFMPSRLKANELFIAEYSNQLVKSAVAKRGCELIKEVATPFVTLVIADLLGVPAEDRQLFMDAIDAAPPPGSLNSDDLLSQNQPLVLMGMHFAGYVQDRRQNPRNDLLSELANATYPDGSMPDAMEIVRLATFLFGAGQDTSAKLLGNTMKFIVDQPGLQQSLRQDPSLIPKLLEEVLRLEGSTKMTARLVRRDSRIGDLKVAAGTKVMLALSAANRDPRRWEQPEALILDRPRIREHLAFGRGAHVCAGAPLARTEVRIILEKFLEHTSDIDLVESKHGRREQRNFDYEASFIIRGLAQLHLKLTPVAGAAGIEPAAVEPVETRSGIAIPGGRAASKPTSGARYSTAETKLGALLSDPAAKAVIDKYFPGVSSDKRIAMAKGMTLRTVQKFAPDRFTNEALDAADAELAQLTAP